MPTQGIKCLRLTHGDSISFLINKRFGSDIRFSLYRLLNCNFRHQPNCTCYHLCRVARNSPPSCFEHGQGQSGALSTEFTLAQPASGCPHLSWHVVSTGCNVDALKLHKFRRRNTKSDCTLQGACVGCAYGPAWCRLAITAAQALLAKQQSVKACQVKCDRCTILHWCFDGRSCFSRVSSWLQVF